MALFQVVYSGGLCVCPGHVLGLLQVTVILLSYIYPLSAF